MLFFGRSIFPILLTSRFLLLASFLYHYATLLLYYFFQLCQQSTNLSEQDVNQKRQSQSRQLCSLLTIHSTANARIIQAEVRLSAVYA